ncbi:glycosyl transferase family 2 [Jannaschia pagri]|uniref:Glycosyl transferase family 2 n=1 Tax=Jannaschia pagri TaxID=2829797 RepID=A0ABQ4NLJ1_9RHOB|nr:MULTISPECIES: glycosyltransferase [unclassified Jannaschia]GIT91420.1 glycosyl transferase family 2 [Jannaschia sp. AI_61]GIT95254.1 glycosyl transferase family 2 [Jannaschia sp. AI_62]
MTLHTRDFGRVDVSLTTIAARLAGVARTLTSLLNQSYANLRIHLYISHDPHLLDTGITDLTPEIQGLVDGSGGRLVVHRCPNWGPYRKLLPYLRANWGQSRLVATADDDTEYPETWLETLLEAYDAHGCVIAYRGHLLSVENGAVAPYRNWMRRQIEESPSRLILPTGKDGVLYDTAFFPMGVLDIATALRIAPTVDDLWFRWHLALNHIPTHLINVDYTSGSFQESDSGGGSLYLGYNLGGGNDGAIAALEAHFRETYDFSITDLAPPES